MRCPVASLPSTVLSTPTGMHDDPRAPTRHGIRPGMMSTPAWSPDGYQCTRAFSCHCPRPPAHQTRASDLSPFRRRHERDHRPEFPPIYAPICSQNPPSSLGLFGFKRLGNRHRLFMPLAGWGYLWCHACAAAAQPRECRDCDAQPRPHHAPEARQRRGRRRERPSSQHATRRVTCNVRHATDLRQHAPDARQGRGGRMSSCTHRMRIHRDPIRQRW